MNLNQRYALVEGQLIRRVGGASSTRGRIERQGGMAVDPQGAAGRTDSSQQTRPAFSMRASYQIPNAPPTAVGGINFHPLFDPSSVSFWRFFWTGAALAYIVGFHIKLGRVRLGVGPA